MTDLHPELRATAPAPLDPPDSALAIGAHPDDIEFGAGGTLARWAAAGTRVTLLVMTDGSKGSWDPAADPAELAVRRTAEQQAAADALGAAEVLQAGHVDGELEYSIALRGQVCEYIRAVRPSVVLGHDPWQRYQLHPDHRVTGMAVVDGVVAARDHLFFPEQGLAPHRPAALLLWFPDEPNHWEDIAGSLDRKVAALLCHASQGPTTMGGAQNGETERHTFATRIENRAAEAGAPAGLAAAEAFRRITP
ncbi:MAG: PIG-L family deacetylase [Acidimicrobiia bacterium]|nr:PIG-L family deacetylase [Acidimicrobiia bacterium]